MKCPKCGNPSVVSQVRAENGRRRRNCTSHLCQHVFHTLEIEVPAEPHGGLKPGAFGRKAKEPA